MPPIFVGITRSFWFAVTALALFFGQGREVVEAFATLLVALWSWVDFAAGYTGLRLPAGDADGLTAWLMRVGPAFAFLAALHQRSGAARPYTLKPTPETIR